MIDSDAFNESSKVYLLANEFIRLAFYLDELLLHQPNKLKN